MEAQILTSQHLTLTSLSTDDTLQWEVRSNASSTSTSTASADNVNSEALGTISLAIRERIATLAFRFGSEVLSEKYASEALNAVLDVAFENGVLAVRWESSVIDGSVDWVSARAVWECGFTFDGVQRASRTIPGHGLVDTMSASLLAEESREPKSPWHGPTAKHPAFADPRDIEALVRQFHVTYNLPIIDDEPNADRERVDMRLALVIEECCELVGAVYGTEARLIMEEAFVRARGADDHSRDTVEVADALGDIAYVVYGMALELGIPMRKVLAEIHGSNLSKLGADGNPIYREDGKVLKGPNYYHPDIRSVLGL